MNKLLLECKKDIQHLVGLEKGWDGYKAVSVSQENASYAIRILEGICSENLLCPQAVPGADGSIQLEWFSNRVEIELHIVAPNNVYIWTNDPLSCHGDEAIHITDSDIIGISSRMEKLLIEGRAR